MATKKDPPNWHDKADEDDDHDDGADVGVASPSRTRRKKDKSTRRPLSAYNLFFKEERARILQELDEGRPRPDYIANSEAALKRVKNGSKAAAKFQAIASTIAGRWKALSAQKRVPYEELAAEEMERYKERKDEFHRNLVRECEMVGRAALSKKPSPVSHESETRPSLREEPTSLLRQSGLLDMGSASSASATLSLPAIMRQGVLANNPLPRPPIGPTASLNALSWSQRNDSLPLALMMRQVEAEQEIARLQELVSQLRRQREIVQSSAAHQSLTQNWARGQADAVAMQMQQESAMRDLSQSTRTANSSVARGQQQEYPASGSGLMFPDIMALAQSLRHPDSANNQSNQNDESAKWKSYFG